MRIIQSFEFDHCTIRQVAYKGNLYMPPHVDNESKIGIVLDGGLIEKSGSDRVEAKRNSVVIKPGHVIHENIFGPRGVRLLSISFKNGYILPDSFQNLAWLHDPRVSFSAYKLWFSLKSVKNDKQLNHHLNVFIQLLDLLKKKKENPPPGWLKSATELLDRYSIDKGTIENISQQMKISRVHFSRSFKKYHFTSAVKYRHYVRMSNLLFCLTSTNKSLADISYECGFSDQSQMSRIVLKETGYTASALRFLLNP
jgi:AraC-like DNA-binding protein